MSNNLSTRLIAGEHFIKLDHGPIIVSRHCKRLEAPYKTATIPDYLSLVDHSLEIASRKRYKKELAHEEAEFNKLVRELEEKKKFLIVALQGRDGAGKSGATSRLYQATGFDRKLFDSIPIGPPSDEERAHPYLWRFFLGDHMPRFGQVRVFDRSWNERLLVEPVMKFTKPEDVQRSYGEIRMFEKLLVSQGGILVKLWLDITKDEQLKRFEDRAKDKPWKYSESDKEARKHWDEYTVVANEMFHRTGTTDAPWYIVSSEDKLYSRVCVLQTINHALRKALRHH